MVQPFEFQKLSLDGAWLIKAFRAEDNRGVFVKDWSRDIFLAAGINHSLLETFYTYSHKGVVRALHFQEIKEQPKLVRCVKGKIWDVIVDLRRESSTYKKWMGVYLEGDSGYELLVPSGFAHGYIVLEDSIVSYKCSANFSAEHDTGIIWNDPDLAIEWPLEEIGGGSNVILSEKDLNLKTFQQWENNKV